MKRRDCCPGAQVLAPRAPSRVASLADIRRGCSFLSARSGSVSGDGGFPSGMAGGSSCELAGFCGSERGGSAAETPSTARSAGQGSPFADR